MSDQEALLQHGKKTILSKLNNNNNKQHLEEHRDKLSRSLELSHISTFLYPTTLKSVGYYAIYPPFKNLRLNVRLSGSRKDTC